MPEFDTAPDLFVATIGEKADVFSMGFINKLREENVSVVRDYLDRSLKAQMKYSDKTGAKYSIVLGDTEIEEGKAKLKNMATGEAVEIELTDVAKVIKESK